MTNIERVETSGNTWKETDNFCEKIQFMQTDDALKEFYSLSENVQDNILENVSAYDENNERINFHLNYTIGYDND